MRILVISQYYYPEQFRINDICEELVNKGHKVTVLTGLPNYPKGEIYEGYENKVGTEIVNGVTVIRCKLRPRYQGRINLALNYLSYLLKATQIVRKFNNDFDLIFVYGLSPVFMISPAKIAKKRLEIPMLIYCCDIWPESIRSSFPNERGVFYKIIKAISSDLYKSADKIICKCYSFVDYLATVCKVDKKRMSVIYEHAEDVYLQVNEEPFDNGVVDLMFLGNIGRSQDCDVILKSLVLIDNSLSYVMHFVGEGSALEDIKELCHTLKLENKVVFHGRKPVAEIIDYYNIADACVLTLTNDSAVGLTVPAKLTSYMASCRPIVAAISGDSVQIIKESNCGLVVESGDYKGLAKCFERIIKEESLRKQMGMNGRTFFQKHFTKEIFISQLEGELKTMRDDIRMNN